MFVTSVTKRLLQYALGRELGYYDQAGHPRHRAGRQEQQLSVLLES